MRQPKSEKEIEPHTWNDECQKAFEIIKEYLLHPPILVPSKPGKPLLLYLSIIKDAVGIMLAQEDDDKNKGAIYYLKFDLKYMARKTIKGSVVSKFCAKNPVEGENGKDDFLDEDILDVELGAWKMYFDGAVNQYGNGIEVILITPNGSQVPLAIKLNFEVTNNMAEYEACIAGMDALRRLGVREAKFFRDSSLVIAQAQKLWKVKEEHLKPYQ
ncbi:uncharacterized protein LOC142605773 [Castanea sativa]|uniref:uncharacterized protein LOC142605773 n=1 Tax=Castanea sativa TaxID=21020 RepID=UPI003F64B4BE